MRWSQAMEVISTAPALDALDTDGRTTATLPAKVTVAANWRALVSDRPAGVRGNTVGEIEGLELPLARERDIEHADPLVRIGAGSRLQPPAQVHSLSERTAITR